MSHEDRNRRATRRALSSGCALLLTLALGTTQVAAQATGAAPTQTDDGAAVEPGMPLAADALRAELARLELELATTRDFAAAEPALAELMQRVLRAGEFDGWQALLADVYVARIDLLLDMDRVEEAGELAGQIGAEWSDLPSAERDAFRARVAAIAHAPRVVAVRARVEARREGGARGGADLRRVVEEALAKGDQRGMLELGSLAVPVLLDLLEPAAAADRFPRPHSDPLFMLLLVEPERSASILEEAVPDPSLALLHRLCAVFRYIRPDRNSRAWVGCDGLRPEYAWIDWLPWFARIVRRSSESQILANAMPQILETFLTADALTPELIEAMRAVVQSSSVEAGSALAAQLTDFAVRQPRAASHLYVRVFHSLDPLREVLWPHPDARFRRIGAALESSRPDLGDLRLMAEDPDPLVRERVAEAFGPVLLSTLIDCPGRSVSRADSWREDAVLREGDDSLIARLVLDPDRRVQTAALETLAWGRLGPLEAGVAREAWETGSSTVRAALLKARWAPEAEWLSLLEVGFGDDSPAVRLAAAERYARGDTPNSIELVRRLAMSREPSLRGAAAGRLLELEDPATCDPLLLELAGDGDRTVRAVVLEQLDEVRDPALLGQLLDTLLITDAAAQEDAARDWLADRLKTIRVDDHPEVLAAVALDETRRRSDSRLLSRALANKSKAGIEYHPAGLRLLALAAMESGESRWWDAALGQVDDISTSDRLATGPNDPLLRDVRWEAWQDLERDQIEQILSAYELHEDVWLPLEILVRRFEPERVAALFLERRPTQLTWYALLHLAGVGDEEQQLAALDRLSDLAVMDSHVFRATDAWRELGSLDVSRRTQWVTEQVVSGRSLGDLDAIIGKGMLGGVTVAGDMQGVRRRLVEATVGRWGGDALLDGPSLRKPFLTAVVGLAGPDADLLSDEWVMAMAEDPLCWDSLWPVVVARASVAFLPLLERVVLYEGRMDLYWAEPDPALDVLRKYPDQLAEPLLISLAERTTVTAIRHRCLNELDERARVRAARTAYESRGNDAAAHARALTEVLALLDDDNWKIRAEAARALGALGGAEQLPRLIALLRDEDAEVRKAAREAIERIHGRDAPAAPVEPQEPVDASGG